MLLGGTWSEWLTDFFEWQFNSCGLIGKRLPNSRVLGVSRQCPFQVCERNDDGDSDDDDDYDDDAGDDYDDDCVIAWIR